jgi:hypothetical protein
MINKTSAIKETDHVPVNHTLEEYPCMQGVTFNLTDEQDNDLTVVNMNHENFTELLRRKIITFPIDIVKLDDHNTFITDIRIPNNWKSEFNEQSYIDNYSCKFT